MKILMVNTLDTQGGATRAAYRIHKGLIDIGVDSAMLVQNKVSNDPSVTTPYDSKIFKVYSSIRPYANVALQKVQQDDNPILHSSNVMPSGLHKKINSSDADIIHLHWINGEMISIEEIAKIKKPIVWTLHDMWAFSGAEHYDDLNSPKRYKKGYYKNNRPDDYSGLDLDRWTWERKMKHWADKNFSIVAPSQWLANCAKESKLFNSKNINIIPYCLDLGLYKPIHQQCAHEIFNISRDSNTKYILFGAISATSDKRKGHSQLKKALTYLNKDNAIKYELLIFGSEGYDDIDFGLPTTYLGRLNDDETLALAYSAADVMVVPSLQDNLPNTAIEATACGTPVVSFNIGGLPDIVDHHGNGYLAEPYSPVDLASGIKWVLEDDNRNAKLGKQARKKAKEQYAIEKVLKQYVELYNKLLNRKEVVNE